MQTAKQARENHAKIDAELGAAMILLQELEEEIGEAVVEASVNPTPETKSALESARRDHMAAKQSVEELRKGVAHAAERLAEAEEQERQSAERKRITDHNKRVSVLIHNLEDVISDYQGEQAKLAEICQLGTELYRLCPKGSIDWNENPSSLLTRAANLRINGDWDSRWHGPSLSAALAEMSRAAYIELEDAA